MLFLFWTIQKTFVKFLRKISEKDFWPTTLLKLNSKMNVFPWSFTNLARSVICHNTLERCFCTNGFYNLMSVIALKNIYCETLRKTFENPLTDCNFLFLSGFYLWVLQTQILGIQIFINSHFSEYRHGFAFAMTYCLQKEKSRKEESFRKK